MISLERQGPNCSCSSGVTSNVSSKTISLNNNQSQNDDWADLNTWCGSQSFCHDSSEEEEQLKTRISIISTKIRLCFGNKFARLIVMPPPSWHWNKYRESENRSRSIILRSFFLRELRLVKLQWVSVITVRMITWKLESWLQVHITVSSWHSHSSKLQISSLPEYTEASTASSIMITVKMTPMRTVILWLAIAITNHDPPGHWWSLISSSSLWWYHSDCLLVTTLTNAQDYSLFTLCSAVLSPALLFTLSRHTAPLPPAQPAWPSPLPHKPAAGDWEGAHSSGITVTRKWRI